MAHATSNLIFWSRQGLSSESPTSRMAYRMLRKSYSQAIKNAPTLACFLHANWPLNRPIQSPPFPPYVDEIVEKNEIAGAIDRKLFGAGGDELCYFLSN